MNNTVAVTGANGFVGRALLRHLRTRSPEAKTRALVRSLPEMPVPGCDYVVTGDLGTARLPEGALDGVGFVVHAAARVHVMRDPTAEPLAAYRQVNVEGTRQLAQAASRSGVRRFIFLSSVKVHGETSPQGRGLREDDALEPVDPYGVSKLEAEQALEGACQGTQMEFVTIRPPLIYGPGVGANFRVLAQAILAGRLLPLGAIRNRRSFLALDNLVDFIELAMVHPAAANQSFLVSDGEALSTPDLVRAMAAGANCRARLLAVPPALLRIALALAGRGAVARRLMDDLALDIGKSRSRLDWRPPVDLALAMRDMMQPGEAL
ncbi:MAG: NAD-dependent epimerase/dehydratase family protein [Ramlibacter sp.]